MRPHLLDAFRKRLVRRREGVALREVRGDLVVNGSAIRGRAGGLHMLESPTEPRERHLLCSHLTSPESKPTDLVDKRQRDPWCKLVVDGAAGLTQRMTEYCRELHAPEFHWIAVPPTGR